MCWNYKSLDLAHDTLAKFKSLPKEAQDAYSEEQIKECVADDTLQLAAWSGCLQWAEKTGRNKHDALRRLAGVRA